MADDKKQPPTETTKEDKTTPDGDTTLDALRRSLSSEDADEKKDSDTDAGTDTDTGAGTETSEQGAAQSWQDDDIDTSDAAPDNQDKPKDAQQDKTSATDKYGDEDEDEGDDESDEQPPELLPAKRSFFRKVARGFLLMGILVFIGFFSYRMGILYGIEQHTPRIPVIVAEITPVRIKPQEHDNAAIQQQDEEDSALTNPALPPPKRPPPRQSRTPIQPVQPKSPSQADFDRLKKEIEALKKQRQQAVPVSPLPSVEEGREKVMTALADKKKKPSPPPSRVSPAAKRTKPPGKPSGSAVLRVPPANSEKRVVPLATRERSRYRVQLGAHRQRIDTDNQWLHLLYKHGDLLAPYRARVEPITRAQTTYYRLQIVPFDSKQKAQRLCDKLKRLGESCWVVYPPGDSGGRL